LDDMVLSPLGVLHDEADRLLREEYPSAIHLRPVLDAIGMGAHKLSEIAGRLGLPATSLSKSIGILIMLGVVSKEIPFGSDEKTSKKSLYKLSDPFLRLWFKVIAPNRSALNVLPPKGRLQLYRSQESTLMSMSFEEICLMSVPYLSGLGQTFIKAGRYWGANEPEWDIVAESLDKKTILIGECKCFEKSINEQKANREFEQLKEKGRPKVLSQYGGKFCYVLFVLRSKVVSSDLPEDCIVITIEDVLAALVYEVE
jgi:AAA+ ATPase superfamily predicted ATPase